jgi:nucleoside phosphorylase
MSFVPPSTRDGFHIAIICALETEYNAVALVFDEFWDDQQDQYGKAQGDPNHYTTGRVGKYNVVLALLPHMGKVNAASAAASMRSSYCCIQLALLVGVCGGAPTGEHGEVLLGDVIISDSVVQYDFGRQYPDKLERKDTTKDNLGRPNKDIRSLLAVLGTDRGIELLEDRTASWLEQLQAKAASKRRIGKDKYKYPGPAKDKLFEPSYRHKHHNSTTCICRGCNRDEDPICDEAVGLSCLDLQCDESHLVQRDRLDEKRQLDSENSAAAQQPAIHIGAVASGDSVIKSAVHRDRIAKQENVIAFEMEGAGVWDEVPCIVVKGVCDYADCHKHKGWQNFAAAVAAAAAKAIFERYTQTDRKEPEAGSSEILDASQNAQSPADTSGRNFRDVNAHNAWFGNKFDKTTFNLN